MAVVSTIQFVAALQSSSRELTDNGYRVTIPQVITNWGRDNNDCSLHYIAICSFADHRLVDGALSSASQNLLGQKADISLL